MNDYKSPKTLPRFCAFCAKKSCPPPPTPCPPFPLAGHAKMCVYVYFPPMIFFPRPLFLSLPFSLPPILLFLLLFLALFAETGTQERRRVYRAACASASCACRRPSVTTRLFALLSRSLPRAPQTRSSPRRCTCRTARAFCRTEGGGTSACEMGVFS